MKERLNQQEIAEEEENVKAEKKVKTDAVKKAILEAEQNISKRWVQAKAIFEAMKNATLEAVAEAKAKAEAKEKGRLEGEAEKEGANWRLKQRQK